MALGLIRLSKLGVAPFLAHYSVGMGPLWRSVGSKFRRGTVAGPLFSSPFLCLSRPFFGRSKTSSVNIR